MKDAICLAIVGISTAVGLWLEITDPSYSIYAFAIAAAATVVRIDERIRCRIAHNRKGDRP